MCFKKIYRLPNDTVSTSELAFVPTKPIARVFNNTFRKYCQYQYRYFIRKVLPILPPILFLESIANTLTNTFDRLFC